MAKFITHNVVRFVFLMLIAITGTATPPGIAKNPSNARCLIKKYKYCYNLEHVCPKFCPDSCTVECVSCKPMCVGSTTTPPSDSESPEPETPTQPTSTPPLDSEHDHPTPADHEDTPPSDSESPEHDHPIPPAVPPPTPTPPIDSPSPPTPMPPTTSPSSPPSTPSNPSGSWTTPSPPTPVSPPTPPPSPPPTTPTSPPPSPFLSPPSPTPSSPSPSPPASTPTPPTSWTPPSSTPTPPKKSKCKNNNYPQCYNVQHTCPSSCPGGCEVDCVTCKPVCKCDMPGAVCQDPRFIGGDGITFYFHGKKDQDFCLVSDPNLHVNAHFIGKRNKNMKRDFTWVQSIGILFDNHKLLIAARKTATWDDTINHLSLAFDEESIQIPETEGATWESQTAPRTSITRITNTNNVIIEVEGIFKITAKVVPITEQESRVHNYGITQDDTFAHLDLGFKFLSLSDEVTGVLGQTYRNDYVSRVKMGAPMPVMGGEKEFATSSLFSTDCSVSIFRRDQDLESSLSLELPSLSCSSGIDGQGVVCKR